MPMIEIDRLSLSFGGIRALDGVSFEVDEGEIFCIIGPNGAGKTTLFNVISRIYPASEGQVRFLGQDITHVAPHRIASLGIARTFQNIELFDQATVLNNLLLGCHCRRRAGLIAEILRLPRLQEMELINRRKAEEVIELLGIQQHRSTLVANLPYGVRKVVELARALCSEPRLLLLDEPSSGLNVEETESIGYWIKDIRDELGTTVLMIEHDMRLVGDIADRVMALNHGRELATGDFESVLRNPAVETAYLGGAIA
jgi:branched-chain amino acid transport system ATP-binding protein